MGTASTASTASVASGNRLALMLGGIAPDLCVGRTERRRAARVAHRASLVLSPWTGRPGGPVTPVLLRDYSQTGIGIVHRQPLDVAGRYVLRLPDGSSGPGVVACEVVRCQPEGGRWYAAGLQFLGPVSLDLLRRGLVFIGPAEAVCERWDGLG